MTAASGAAGWKTPRLTLASTSTPAVVLKFEPNVMHHGGLGAIRSLGRLGVPVYGVHESRWAPAANSRYLHGRWLWHPDSEHPEHVHTGLLDVARQIGRPAVLIPTDDAGAIFLAEHGEALRPWFIFPAPPAGLPRRLAGKYSLYQACREFGVPCPWAAVPGTKSDARQVATGYPVIAKLVTPWRDTSRRLHSTALINGPAELDEYFDACQAVGATLMLQEFVPPSPECDWFFHGYCDAAATCRVAFTGIKDRSYPAGCGLTSLGRSVPNPGLRDQVTALLTRLGYQGIVDLDLRYDHRDGQYKLLDFNPRLGAQFRLFHDTGGLDVVRAAYADLTGNPASYGEQVNGRKFLVENYDPLTAIRSWRQGNLSLWAWARSLRGTSETAWFARDDLLPFVLMCLRMGWRAVSRPFARDAAPGVRFHHPRFGPGRRQQSGTHPPGRVCAGQTCPVHQMPER